MVYFTFEEAVRDPRPGVPLDLDKLRLAAEVARRERLEPPAWPPRVQQALVPEPLSTAPPLRGRDPVDEGERLEAFLAKRQPPLPPLPAEGLPSPKLQVNGLAGPLCEVQCDLLDVDMLKQDERGMLGCLKSLVQSATGIPTREQQLVVDPSWQQATLVRVLPPSLALAIREVVTAELNESAESCQAAAACNEDRDSATCAGSLTVTALDASVLSLPCCRLGALNRDFRYKVNPSLRKDLCLRKNSLDQELLEPRRVFRLRSSQVPLLKWQRSCLDVLPFRLTCRCFPEPPGVRVVVELAQKELTQTGPPPLLERINVHFPTRPPQPGVDGPPTIVEVDAGTASFDEAHCGVVWQIPKLDRASARLEFLLPCSAAFSVRCCLEAEGKQLVNDSVTVLACHDLETQEPIRFTCEEALTYRLSHLVQFGYGNGASPPRIAKKLWVP